MFGFPVRTAQRKENRLNRTLKGTVQRSTGVREQKGEDAYGSKLGRTGAKNRCKQDTRSIRKGIEEALACELYGLTDEEVAIVEGKE